MILPGQIVSLVVLVLPVLVALYMSFTDWSPTRGSLIEAEFVGLDNYLELLVYDTRFVEAIVRTLLISLVCLSLEFSLGLGLAVLFLREFRGKSLFFSALFIPMMVLPVVVGYTFWMLFQSNGPVNQIIGLIFGAAAAPQWFRQTPFAIAAVIITEVWHWTPLFPRSSFWIECRPPKSYSRRGDPRGKAAPSLLASNSPSAETDHHCRPYRSLNGDHQVV